jgi:hypothetical protein
MGVVQGSLKPLLRIDVGKVEEREHRSRDTETVPRHSPKPVALVDDDSGPRAVDTGRDAHMRKIDRRSELPDQGSRVVGRNGVDAASQARRHDPLCGTDRDTGRDVYPSMKWRPQSAGETAVDRPGREPDPEGLGTTEDGMLVGRHLQ